MARTYLRHTLEQNRAQFIWISGFLFVEVQTQSDTLLNQPERSEG